MCTDTARYARTSTGLDVLLSFPFVRVMKEEKREERGRREGRRVKNRIDRLEKSKSSMDILPRSICLDEPTSTRSMDPFQIFR